jgi:hypothetical protein
LGRPKPGVLNAPWLLAHANACARALTTALLRRAPSGRRQGPDPGAGGEGEGEVVASSRESMLVVSGGGG